MALGDEIRAEVESCADGPLGLRERQRVARDQAILDAAFALIVEKGYNALTMEGVAARVGISRQTLYHHFASREEIALRAVLTLMDQGIAVIHSLDQALAPVERLKAVARWMLESRFQPARAALVKVRHSLMTVKSHPDYQLAFERRAAALDEIVAAAQADGELRADLPSRLIVQMLLGLVSDASYEGLIADGRTTLAQATDAIIDVFFTGLHP
jgi:TetR/AcrR family transcriptional regulator, regulator of autoinduction and epiphytic fitness